MAPLHKRRQSPLTAINRSCESHVYPCARTSYFGFANVTTLQLTQHLLATYGRITAHSLHENDILFRKAMDPGLPFESFITQIDEAVEYANAGETPYNAAQIVANAYNNAFQTGLFPDVCREWRRRPSVEHTWSNFKTDFAEARRDHRLVTNSAQAQSYHGHGAANSVTENFFMDTADAFTNLATATTALHGYCRCLYQFGHSHHC
jgi:hypothetical protein